MRQAIYTSQTMLCHTEKMTYSMKFRGSRYVVVITLAKKPVTLVKKLLVLQFQVVSLL